MKSSQLNKKGDHLGMIQVPDLMTDPSYLRQLSGGKQYPENMYFSTLDLDEEYASRSITRGIQEIVASIDAVDRYKYSNSSATYSLFQNYLIALTRLKDFLLPSTEGRFTERWMCLALEFQHRCEEIFLKYVKEEYILTFLPMVPKQLEYTSTKLRVFLNSHQNQEMQAMSTTEFTDFQNLFSLIALGFIGKLKLLSFYLSLSIMKNPSIDPELITTDDKQDLEGFKGDREQEGVQGSPDRLTSENRTTSEVSLFEDLHREFVSVCKEMEESSGSRSPDSSFSPAGRSDDTSSDSSDSKEHETQKPSTNCGSGVESVNKNTGAKRSSNGNSGNSNRGKRRSSRLNV